jgi:hypothetical protein
MVTEKIVAGSTPSTFSSVVTRCFSLSLLTQVLNQSLIATIASLGNRDGVIVYISFPALAPARLRLLSSLAYF